MHFSASLHTLLWIVLFRCWHECFAG